MTASVRHAAGPVLVVLFAVFHMTSVALYLLPEDIGGPMGAVRSFTKPYVLLFSQWQKWDIFSPDPLRRISDARIERNTGDRWETALLLSYAHLPIVTRARELKILERIGGDWKVLAPSYLRSLCDRIQDAPGSDLRLFVRTSVLPKDLKTLRSYATARPDTTEEVLGTVRCPRAP